MSYPKQVIVIRKDLNMRKGKMIAQGAHASMKVFFDMMWMSDTVFVDSKTPEDFCQDDEATMSLQMNVGTALWEWVTGSFAKIAVSVDSEEELLSIYQQAKDAEIPCALIQDSGRTEFHGEPTYTAVAIGPGWPDKIDPITGNLKLL